MTISGIVTVLLAHSRSEDIETFRDLSFASCARQHQWTKYASHEMGSTATITISTVGSFPRNGSAELCLSWNQGCSTNQMVRFSLLEPLERKLKQQKTKRQKRFWEKILIKTWVGAKKCHLEHLTGVCPVKKASVIALRRNLLYQ